MESKPFSQVVEYSNKIELPAATITRGVDLYGKQANPLLKTVPLGNKPLIGIEVEVEGMTGNKWPDLIFWTSVAEGSLRGAGREFRSAPLKPYHVPHAVTELNEFLEKCHPDHKFSERCSVHAHMDFRNATPDVLLKYIVLYSIAETALFHFAGIKRKNSNFCVPLNATAGKMSLRPYLHALQNNMPISEARLLTDLCHWISGKYAALNVQNMMYVLNRDHKLPYGTLEFRHMEGNATPLYISRWVYFLIRIREAAEKLTFPELETLVTTISSYDHYFEAMHTLFGKGAARVIPPQEMWGEIHADIVSSCAYFASRLNSNPKDVVWPATRSVLFQRAKQRSSVNTY